MADTTLTEADMRPGERLVAGRRYVFNEDLLNDHLAREAVANPPASYRKLSVSDLTLLISRCVRVWALERGAKGAHTGVQRACVTELARRGLNSMGSPVGTRHSRAA